ncbi:hypothetical protein JMK98_05245 [Pediococcus pentosaceus]|uniref:hypothetical protein n=1 Tax=Pediococcus pentosaceus TaxID=1255 RepID=UPI0013039223|nr:hypothetical protein [Pediococcus pentosaceus]KAF0506490.1 hypothetical protein GBP24_04700 [Pediococcus pentosaceus]MBF7139600.1 hypothetical protein [Pediococcus pentosaceus]MBM9929882.1 hypothetical protein [Pediococcus pentosaceus]MCM6820203.1 hypothetical protein [Pediococcus pentosaceus]MDE3751679.1 hypothetical protein [Pediococcus pentosaceus]
MFKKISLLLVTGLSILLLASCKSTANGNTANDSSSSAKTSKSHTSESTSPSSSSSSSSSEEESSQDQSTTTNPLTFDEGMQILQQSVYKDYINDSPQLVNNDNHKLVISAYAGAKGINYFTLTPSGSNQVKIHAEFGTLDGGKFTNLHDVDAPEYQTVTRPNATASTSSNDNDSSSTIQSVPAKFIGKWKKTDSFKTESDGKKYEYAKLFHATSNSILLGETYTDCYKYTVSSCKSLGPNDYAVETKVPITNESQTIYLHYYSKDKIGEKFNSSDDFTIFDSRAPVLNYDASEW